MADYYSLLQDRSWATGDYAQQLKNLSESLQKLGVKPNTSEFDSAFYSILGMVSSSSLAVPNDVYASPTGNLALKNYANQNLDYKTRQELGLSATGMYGFGPDVGGWYSSTGEYIPVSDPYARTATGQTIKDSSGKPILMDVYAVQEFYRNLYGREATPEEIQRGISQYVNQETGQYFGGGYSPSFSKNMGYGTGIGGFKNNNAGNGNTGDGNTGSTGGLTTNLDVLKSVLRGLGFNSSIVDSSSSFLLALLKDGLDYDNATQVFLNAKDYTTKDGKKLDSPFYAEYGYLNEGLVKPKSAAELYNAVEGYKEVAANYNLNSKFLSKDYLKNYVKNNVSVAAFSERANLARLKSVNADPAYLDSLRRFGYISSAADLTDFFLDPEVGQETMNQRRASVAFGAEAIKRAKQGVQFSTERFNQIVSGLLSKGISPEGVEVTAAEGFANIAETLMPMGKLASIYDRLPSGEVATSAMQAELEAEQFTGLASQRRKRLGELETRAFQATSGTRGGISLAKSPTRGII